MARENRSRMENSSKGLKIRKKATAMWKKFIGVLIEPKNTAIVGTVFVILDLILNVIVIEKVRYTEIDWKAYMQQVEGFVNGTLDYSKLRGDTGPLVYPAGFLYIFTILYYVTSAGGNIKLAQYIFAILYISLLYLVFRIYSKTKLVPPYVLILMFCTSYRIHSIFVLRLFNDPIAIIFLFAAINAFLDGKWFIGSILYSLGVSVKMNVLLFAPGLLVAYYYNLGFLKTVVHLTVCALVQLIMGLPFLIVNPYSYVKGAFDFGRVFEHKWTVNWRFLNQDVFVNPKFHAVLLVLHLATIAFFLRGWISHMKIYARTRNILANMDKKKLKDWNVSADDKFFVKALFEANFIGIVFSRSLHYQFYVWYYYTLPYLAWRTSYSVPVKIVILGIIEWCWNVYPSTIYSSLALHACHVALLYSLKKQPIVSGVPRKTD